MPELYNRIIESRLWPDAYILNIHPGLSPLFNEMLKFCHIGQNNPFKAINGVRLDL